MGKTQKKEKNQGNSQRKWWCWWGGGDNLDWFTTVDHPLVKLITSFLFPLFSKFLNCETTRTPRKSSMMMLFLGKKNSHDLLMRSGTLNLVLMLWEDACIPLSIPLSLFPQWPVKTQHCNPESLLFSYRESLLLSLLWSWISYYDSLSSVPCFFLHYAMWERKGGSSAIAEYPLTHPSRIWTFLCKFWLQG